MQVKPFENAKSQIGYCGLWCGSCIVGNGTLQELTKRYEGLIKGYGVNEWGAKDFDSGEFMKGLASIQNLYLSLTISHCRCSAWRDLRLGSVRL